MVLAAASRALVTRSTIAAMIATNSKGDLFLAESVARALRATGLGPLRQVDVWARHGAITLLGRVPSYYLKQLAQERARGVAGVVAVRNNLDVAPPPMAEPRVRIHKIAWNGNAGELWYTDADGAVDHLRTLLGSCGFRFGTPVALPGDGALHALPVVKRGCSLTELQDVCRNDPGVEIGPRDGEMVGGEQTLVGALTDLPRPAAKRPNKPSQGPQGPQVESLGVELP
jgi:hypothetical protein